MGVQPKISVVMPVYNRQAYLDDAITSIVNQTYNDFEFIIVDDASTDKSLNIINFHSNTDERIFVLNNKNNLGIAKTRNIGIDAAEGKYIAFMDSDDISHPERFQRQVNYLDKHPEIGVLGTQCAYISENGRITSTHLAPLTPIEIRWSLISKSTMINSSIMARSEIFKYHGFKHNDLVAGSDYELWARVSDKFQIANLPDVLLYVREHPKRISKQFRNNQQINAFEIIRKRVKDITDIQLSDDQIEGFRFSRRTKDLEDAVIISEAIVILQKAAMSWSDKKEDQKKIQKMAAGKLRAIWNSQNWDIRLLPYVFYAFWLDPGSLKYLDPGKR